MGVHEDRGKEEIRYSTEIVKNFPIKRDADYLNKNKNGLRKNKEMLKNKTDMVNLDCY
jgi:hypothetical protein